MAIELERVTTPAGMKQALAIRRTVFIEGQNVPESIEIDGYDDFPSVTEGVAHGLLRLDGEPVATGRFVPDGEEGHFAKVGRVAVLEHVRGRGLGRVMMRWLEQEAAQLGYGGVRLSAQLHALGFYEGLGYVGYGEIFMEADIEHRWMELSLR